MHDSHGNISLALAAEIACELFQFRGSATRLPGERDLNFLLTGEDGSKSVLKIATDEREFASIRAQARRLNQLPRGPWEFPQLIPTPSGHLTVDWQTPEGKNCLVRLARYCRGTPWAKVRPSDPQALRDWGAMLGWLDRHWHALQENSEKAPQASEPNRGGTEHTMGAAFFWNLSRGIEVLARRRSDLPTATEVAWIDAVAARYQQYVAPRIHWLRTSFLHNDANDYNVLLRRASDNRCGWRVSGLIDFGDLSYGPTIFELAIGLAYAVLHRGDELTAACAMTAGYHEQFSLTENELEVLWGLVLLRQAVSLVNAAAAQRQRPDDPYLTISQEPMRRSLPRLLAIPHRLATASLRHACGYSPHPASQHVVQWLAGQTDAIKPVMPTLAMNEPPAMIDFSVGSDQLRGDPQSFAYMTNVQVQHELQNQGATWGIGGYEEPRLVYASDQFGATDGEGRPANVDRFAERRTIHLGLDIFAPAGTPVASPLAGVVAAAAVIDLPLDYGGVIVLRHVTGNEQPFYTLYGHLSRAAVAHATVGKPIAAGECFADLGTEQENGGWAPHLHLQLIVDDLDLLTHFPGVCRASERPIWTQLSPDATWLVPPVRNWLRRPSSSDEKPLAARRRARFGTNVRCSYREPLHLVRGWMQYLFDADGRRYLDAYNNVPHVGHCHPRVVTSVTRQISLLNSNTRYLSEIVIEYADRLVSRCPGHLEVCYLLNSASEANELAIRMARAATGGTDLIVLAGAYHGHTTTLIDVSPYKNSGPGGAGPPDWVSVVPVADDFRGEYRRGEPRIAERYAERVEQTIETLGRRGRRLAGWLAETCPSVAGQLVLPAGYLQAVYRAVRQAGGVTIADEVQTGLGRMGNTFFAFETDGVIPDILVLGKPLGNGFPLAAVITSRHIAERFDNGMEFFSTFGGNQVACAAGLAVLQVLEEEGLQTHARDVGEYLRQGFEQLQREYALIGDVRGRGLFWGLELVTDRHTLAPADDEAWEIVESLKRRGILIGRDGSLKNVLKIRPPMPFNRENADSLLAALDDALRDVTRWSTTCVE